MVPGHNTGLFKVSFWCFELGPCVSQCLWGDQTEGLHQLGHRSECSWPGREPHEEHEQDPSSLHHGEGNGCSHTAISFKYNFSTTNNDFNDSGGKRLFLISYIYTFNSHISYSIFIKIVSDLKMNTDFPFILSIPSLFLSVLFCN